MHYDNVYELIITVVFSMIHQLGGLGPKSQDFLIPFCLVEGEPLTAFHLRSLAIISEIVSMRYQTLKINNLTGKYIMEMSKLKNLQRYMTYIEQDFIRFECQPQSNQPSIEFTPSMEVIFETL